MLLSPAASNQDEADPASCPDRPYPGFLMVSVVPADSNKAAQATFSLYDENGSLRYVKTKTAK